MTTKILYTGDNKEELQETIREWFNQDPRVSFRIDEAFTTDGETSSTSPVFVAIVPAFKDGELYTFYHIKPEDVVKVMREDVWPTLDVSKSKTNN